jgi:hypothetical protein
MFSRRWTLTILISVVIGFASWLVYERTQRFACPSQTRTTQLQLPSYPNAQHLTIVPRVAGATHVQDITFLTTDRPQTVVTFYTDKLYQTHWQLTGQEAETVWIFNQTEAVPLYSLIMKIAPAADGRAEVNLSLSYGPCIRA